MGLKGYITLPFIYEFQKDHRRVVIDYVAKYGRNFGLKGLFRNLHFFTDPKFVQHVLYSNNTNYPRAPSPLFDRIENITGRLKRKDILLRWRKGKANILNPAFTESAVKKYTNRMGDETNEHLDKWETSHSKCPVDPSAVKKYTDVLVKGTEEHLQKWQDDALKGQHGVAIFKLIQRLALQNLITTLLGNVNLDKEHFIRTIDEFAELVLKWELSINKLPWMFPTKTLARTKKVLSDLFAIQDIIIKHCLSDEVKDVTVFKEISKHFDEYRLEQNPEDLNTYMQSVAGLYTIAGFDSISHALPMAFAYISSYPAIAENIREEVQRVTGGGKITAENVDALMYTRSVFMESLRHSGGIFPLLIRQAYKDDKIGDYQVKSGDKIIIPVHYISHLPEFWENPEGFDPKRFYTIDTLGEHYRYAHLTFGAGLTGCVGRHFAILECTIILAMAISRFKIELTPYQHVSPDHPSKITVTIKKL